MEGKGECVDAKVNTEKFKQIKEEQTKINEVQDKHDTRLQKLEQNSFLMEKEFSNLKASQNEQKILMLELDSKSTEKNDKMFDRILTGQAKNEEKNDIKLTSIIEGMKETKRIEKDTKDKKIEWTKGKLAVLMVIFSAVLSFLFVILASIFL